MPGTSYVTLAEAAAWLGLDGADRDEEIRAAIETASAAITTHCNADLGLLSGSELLFGLGGDLLFPKRGPLVSVSSCTDERGATIPVRVSREAIKRTDGRSFGRGEEFTVTYTAGLDPLPANLVLAAKLYVAGLMTAPAYDPNLSNETVAGIATGTFAGDGPGSMPPPVKALLQRFVRLVPF